MLADFSLIRMALYNNPFVDIFEKERDGYRAQLDKTQREIELLTGQLKLKDTIIKGKDEMLDLLRAGSIDLIDSTFLKNEELMKTGIFTLARDSTGHVRLPAKEVSGRDEISIVLM